MYAEKEIYRFVLNTNIYIVSDLDGNSEEKLRGRFFRLDVKVPGGLKFIGTSSRTWKKQFKRYAKLYEAGMFPVQTILQIVEVIVKQFPFAKVDWAYSGTAYVYLNGIKIRVSDHDEGPLRGKCDLYLWKGAHTEADIVALINKSSR